MRETAFHAVAVMAGVVLLGLVGTGCGSGTNIGAELGQIPSPSGPLFEAAANGDLDGVKAAIEGGASPNDVGAAGTTALHYAAHGNHIAVIEYLVEQGADVNAQDSQGRTPLGLATETDNVSAQEVLDELGAYR